MGNKRFRDAVAAALPAYMEADNRYDKSLVVHAIVNEIRQAGGRFLKNNFTTGTWCELNDQQAKEKVGHAVRDAVTAYENRKKRKRRKSREESKSDKPPPSSSVNLHQAFATLSTTLHRPVHSPSVAAVASAAAVSAPEPYPAPSAMVLPYNNPLALYPETVALPMDPQVAAAVSARSGAAAAIAPSRTTSAQRLPDPRHHLQSSHPAYPHLHPQRHPLPPHHHQQLQPQQQPQPQQQQQPQPLRHQEGDPHDPFLAAIDSVLGPLPPDASDPMSRFFGERQRRHGQDPGPDPRRH